MALQDFSVKQGLNIAVPLPISMGGTGQSTANNALNALLPSQSTHANKYLLTDGTNTSWGVITGYSAPTIGTTLITSGGTFTTLPGVTSINGATVPSSGTLATTSQLYSAPTLGSTSIGSGATVLNIDSLTINSTTIPTSKTLVDTDSTQTLTNKTLGSTIALSANLNASSNKIINLATPTSDQDAATKAYVDAATAGLNVHDSVKAATTTNINLSTDLENSDILDGVTLVTGNRILVKNQTTKSENGVYVVQVSGAAVRAEDYNTAGEVDAGDFIFVEGGTINAKTGWVQTNAITTLDTDDIEFTQFSGAGTYLAGTGLTLTGTTFSINTGTTVDLNTSQTLTNKNISLTSNTISGTTAEFNTALSDGDFATLAGTETLTNKTLTSPVIGTISNTGTLTLPTSTDTLVGRATTDTLTNKSISGSTNTITNIANSSLTNSTISGVALGNNLNTLTIGTGLSGTSYNGSAATTIAIDSTVVTLTGTQTLTNKTLTSPIISSIVNTGTLTLPTSTDTLVGRATTDTLTNKTISGTNNTISNIGNSSLTNSSITINGSSISLGGSATITANTTNALTIGTGLSGTSFNGSNAVTIAIDSTVATLTGTQTFTNKTLTSPVISTIVNTGTLTLPTSTDTLVGRATTDTLTNKILSTTSTTTINTNNATTIDTTALSGFTSMKFFISIKQGSKIRSSELIVQTDGTTVDHSEYSVVETGGLMNAVSVVASVSSTNCITTITIGNAATTNATVKIFKVLM